MASNEGVENRPFPYLTVDADLLSNLRQSAAEGLFHSFDLLVGKDAREAGIKFEVLLGVYTNAIQYVRFLETALAVSCVNTEFKDLSRMTDGKIQFRISVPTIAHGDGRRPSKQRTFIVVKNCHKHHISTEMELSMLDLEILHSIPETPVEYAEYVGAVKTVASALQFGVDALERGLINTVLSVKLRHAPPMFILQTLADPTFTERGFSKTVKSDLIAMFKRHLLEHSFFLDRAENMGSGFSQYVRSRLSEMVAAVSGESVLKGVSTYTTAKGGEPVGGIKNRLFTLLELRNRSQIQVLHKRFLEGLLDCASLLRLDPSCINRIASEGLFDFSKRSIAHSKNRHECALLGHRHSANVTKLVVNERKTRLDILGRNANFLTRCKHQVNLRQSPIFLTLLRHIRRRLGLGRASVKREITLLLAHLKDSPHPPP